MLRLNVGDRLMLASPSGAPVRLRCGDVPLFEGQLGRRENRLAVRIDGGREISPAAIQARLEGRGA